MLKFQQTRHTVEITLDQAILLKFNRPAHAIVEISLKFLLTDKATLLKVQQTRPCTLVEISTDHATLLKFEQTSPCALVEVSTDQATLFVEISTDQATMLNFNLCTR